MTSQQRHPVAPKLAPNSQGLLNYARRRQFWGFFLAHFGGFFKAALLNHGDVLLFGSKVVQPELNWEMQVIIG